MGKPGARKGDKITSQSTGDPHIALQPGPSGLVPVPQVISVSNSVIKDKVAKKVNVMGQPGAVKGSVSKHSPPHVPIPPAVKFQKPPSNKGEIVTGSANVLYEGKPAAMLGDTAKMCADPSDAPVGRVVGDAKQVNIGGGGKDKDGEEDADGAAAKAKKARCTAKAHVGSATTTGHPINVASGELIISGEDFDLDGPLPIQFIRTYLSTGAAEAGPLGHGWSHNLQESIERIENGHPEWAMVDGIFASGGDAAPDGRYIAHLDPNGVPTHYQALAEGEEAFDVLHETTLRHAAGVYELVDRSGITRRFEHVAGPEATLQLVSVVDRNGNTRRHRYDPEGRVNEIIDCYGRRLGVAYDETSRIIAIRFRTSAGAGWTTGCSYRYDESGDLVEVTNRAGASCSFAYADHLVVEDTNRDGYSYFFQYDESRRCIGTWGQDGHLTRHLQYDRTGRRTREINGEGEQTLYEYDEWDRVVRTEKGSDVEVELNLDEDGRLVSRTNGNVTVATIEYDGFGNTKSVTHGDGATTCFEHNSAGQVTKQINALGEESAFLYDERGNMVERSAPGRGTTRFERDERGRVVRATAGDGRVTVRRYDAFGHPTEVGPLGRTSRFEFSPLGELLRAVSAEGIETIYEWDARGFLTQESAEGRIVRRYAYSSEGGITEHLDAEGQLVRRTLAAPGVVVRKEIFDAANPEERPALLRSKDYDCDSEGRIRRIAASNGASVSYAFDDAGRIASRETSDGLLEKYQYDRAGLLCTIEDQTGAKRQIRYDEQARVSGIGHADGSWDTLEYDALGRMVGADNAAGHIEIAYGPDGGRTLERFGDFELASQADLQQRRVSSVAEDAYRRDELFDERAGVVSLRLGPLSVEIERDASGRLVGRRYSNGAAEQIVHDAYGRVCGVELATASGHHRREIDFDRERICAIRDSLRGDRQYHYDRLGRLAGVDGERPESYRYDAGDNLLSSHRYEDSVLLDRLRLGTAGRTSYGYDDNGRVVRLSRSTGALELEYDEMGLVSLARLPDGGEVHYVYDAVARRVAKRFTGGREDGLEIRTDWRGDSPCREVWTRHGEVEAETTFLFENGAPLAHVEDRDGEIRQIFYHSDHLGTPIVCTDESGEIVWRSEADAFGWSADESAVPHAFRLPGQYYDFETGLCYNRWRTFDPWTGRYLQLDPIAPPIEANPYGYPLDPLRYVDPLGLSKTLVVLYDTKGTHGSELSFGYGARVKHHSELTKSDFEDVTHVVISAHGTPNRITTSDAYGEETDPMWGDQVAADLRGKGFEGDRVTVVACSSGGQREGFAQKLADGLGPGSKVEAWDSSVSVDEWGHVREVKQGAEAVTLPDGSEGYRWCDFHAVDEERSWMSIGRAKEEA